MSEPRVPVVDLPRVDAAQFFFYDHTVGSFLVTEDARLSEMVDEFTSQPPSTIATDIETRGLDTLRFSITAASVAFRLGADTVSLLFDPLRRDHHRRMLQRMYEHASTVVFHNAAYDVAPLYAHRLITRDQIRKISDTLIAARMIDTHNRGGRGLEELAVRYGVMGDDRTVMKTVFAARGLKKDEGFWSTDIDCTTYVVGALSDTVATLRLWGTPGVNGHGIASAAARYLTSPAYGFGGQGVLAPAAAEKVVEDAQQVNRIVLERTARGYNVDTEFPERFLAENGKKSQEAAQLLVAAGVRPRNGADLVKLLVERGEINPTLWPRTDKGALSAKAEHLKLLEDLEHGSPLVDAYKIVANTEKVLGYVTKVVENAGPTGRMHPEIKILGACATGRMAASSPEIQQFPDQARGVIIADDQEWVSCDWKSIEPVVLATASGDGDFLAMMRAGGDPYEPVGEVAGIDRKLAKRKMLADMYGQGFAAAQLQFGWSLEETKRITYTIRDGLPILYRLIDALKAQSAAEGRVTTLTGRVMDQRFYYGEASPWGNSEYKARAAPNHFCQGTALDVMHHTILELDRRGLSDHVHLWMHDEVVADVSIQAEVEEVMRTPPPFLAEVAHHHGIEPFLAVDSEVLGWAWRSC